jgi:hypothetical protein
MDEPPDSPARDSQQEHPKRQRNKRLVKFLRLLGRKAARFFHLLRTHTEILTALSTFVIAAFTVVLAIATLELKYLGEKQAIDTSTLASAALQQAEASNKQANAAENASSIAREAMERQLRPYLSVKDFEFPCKECGDWEGRVWAINRGQTPARQVEFVLTWDTDPRCGHLNSGFEYHYTDDHGPVSYPGAQKIFFEHLRAFSRDDADSAKFTLPDNPAGVSKDATFCIYGGFLYATPSGDHRTTHFCWWYRPSDRRHSLCQDENDLD